MTVNEDSARLSGQKNRDQQPSAGEEELDEFKRRIRHVLHRMNNNLTALSLSLENMALTAAPEPKNAERLQTLNLLAGELTTDLRELTQFCRLGGSN